MPVKIRLTRFVCLGLRCLGLRNSQPTCVNSSTEECIIRIYYHLVQSLVLY